MKTLAVIALAGALTACNCGTMSTAHVANYVRKCNSAELDYVIKYNDDGKATDVTCYKPGSPPPGSKYPPMSTTVPTTEYVR